MFASVIVPFAISLDVTAPVASLAVVIAPPEITGAAAVVPVPPKSPASCTIPLLEAVASGAPALTTESTYVLFVAWPPRDGEGTTGEAENVLIPAIVSLLVLCTTALLSALVLKLPDAFSVPSALCSTAKKSLRTLPHVPSSAPGCGSRAIVTYYFSISSAR